MFFSQAIRYRRIINTDCILKDRLAELKTYFVKSGYPEKLISSILDGVFSKPRSLVYNNTRPTKNFITPWVVTYGPGFAETKKCAEEVNEMLSLSDTWKDRAVRRIIQVVPRRAPNLKDILFKRKSISLYSPCDAGTVPCNATGCMTCSLVSNTVFLHNKGKKIITSGGIASLGI